MLYGLNDSLFIHGQSLLVLAIKVKLFHGAISQHECFFLTLLTFQGRQHALNVKVAVYV